MFGWLTGTSTVECSPGVDSTIQAGAKGMMSDPIEDMTPEKFNEKFWKWVKDQPAFTSYETGRDVSGTKEDGMVVAFHIEVSGIAALLVSFKASMYNKYYQKDGCYYIEQYAADKELKKLGHKTILKPTTDPFRLEIFDMETGTRRAGPFLKGMLENELKSIEITFDKVEADQPSPSTPGEFSLVAYGVSEEYTSTEALWNKYKSAMLEKGAKEEADGSVKMENSGFLADTTYSLSSYSKDKDEIVGIECGKDATCKDPQMTIHTKLLKDPVRIERWVFPKAKVVSDEDGCKGMSQYITAMVNMAD
mmetsp:Transcript_51700/g.63295  ORF Transcript_51700/g.63295 Transcript_51700/m.63295 type:complete len:306 (+) Transcript_51700:52-969(+)